jgi:hypothetical protein|tara:strand:+ start:452 stop:676 length:225 start_codon:yes stop_codon:yes gene_type:complete
MQLQQHMLVVVETEIKMVQPQEEVQVVQVVEEQVVVIPLKQLLMQLQIQVVAEVVILAVQARAHKVVEEQVVQV